MTILNWSFPQIRAQMDKNNSGADSLFFALMLPLLLYIVYLIREFQVIYEINRMSGSERLVPCERICHKQIQISDINWFFSNFREVFSKIRETNTNDRNEINFHISLLRWEHMFDLIELIKFFFPEHFITIEIIFES